MKCKAVLQAELTVKTTAKHLGMPFIDSNLSDIGGNLNETDQSVATESSWISESNLSVIQLEFNDPFEGILYRTHVSETKLNSLFVSSVFF